MFRANWPPACTGGIHFISFHLGPPLPLPLPLPLAAQRALLPRPLLPAETVCGPRTCRRSISEVGLLCLLVAFRFGHGQASFGLTSSPSDVPGERRPVVVASSGQQLPAASRQTCAQQLAGRPARLWPQTGSRPAGQLRDSRAKIGPKL